jgi:hypothetical protein
LAYRYLDERFIEALENKVLQIETPDFTTIKVKSGVLFIAFFSRKS